MVSYVERKRTPNGSVFVGFQRSQPGLCQPESGNEWPIDAHSLCRLIPASFVSVRERSTISVASVSIAAMRTITSGDTPNRNTLAWSTTFLAGVVVPLPIMLVLSAASSPLTVAGGPIFTLGLMGVGIIAAATAGHFWIGALLALFNTACLIVLARVMGMPALPDPLSVGLAMIIASGSFAARGALFAKTLSHRGWLMALFVVAGEGSVLLTATAFPGLLPNWFLALLPAQWASIAVQSALTGSGAYSAMSVLIALAGTAATTLLAARLWFRRWPYILMFTAWLGLSAYVYFSSVFTTPGVGSGL